MSHHPSEHRRSLGLRICADLDRIPALQPTAVMYFVICQYKDARYVVERDITRMTREATIADIQSRNLTDIVSIIETEFTPHGLNGHMHSRDVTASMLMEAELQRSMLGIDEPEPIDRQANAFDHAHDLRKHEAV